MGSSSGVGGFHVDLGVLEGHGFEFVYYRRWPFTVEMWRLRIESNTQAIIMSTIALITVLLAHLIVQFFPQLQRFELNWWSLGLNLDYVVLRVLVSVN